MLKTSLSILLIITFLRIYSQEKLGSILISYGNSTESLHFKRSDGYDFNLKEYKRIPDFTFYFQYKYPVFQNSFIRGGISSIYTRYFNLELYNWNTNYRNMLPIMSNEAFIGIGYNYKYININLLFDYEILSIKRLKIYNSFGFVFDFCLFKSQEIIFAKYYYDSYHVYDIFKYYNSSVNKFRDAITDLYFSVPISFDIIKRVSLNFEPNISYSLYPLIKGTKRANTFTLELRFGVLLK